MNNLTKEDCTGVRPDLEAVDQHHWLVQEIFHDWENQTSKKFEFWKKFKTLFVGVDELALAFAFAAAAFAAFVFAAFAFAAAAFAAAAFATFVFAAAAFAALAGLPVFGVIKLIWQYMSYITSFSSKRELRQKKQRFLSDKQFCFEETVKYLSEVYKPRLRAELDQLKAEISTLGNNTKDELEADLKQVQSGLGKYSLSAMQRKNLQATKDAIEQKLKDLQSEQASKLKAQVTQAESAISVVKETAEDFRLAATAHADYQNSLAPLVEKYASSQSSYRSVNAEAHQFAEIMSKLDKVTFKGELVKDFGEQVLDGSRQLTSSPVEQLMAGEH